jgi:DNA-binding NtrC family response regulator
MIDQGASTMTILFAWLGNMDIQCLKQNNPDDVGPIGLAVKQGGYSHLVLLSNYPKKDTDAYIATFTGLFSCTLNRYNISLSSPTEYSEIYEAAVDVIGKTKEKYQTDEPNMTFHLSPGTPAMAAVWVIIAHSVHPAELIETSREAGLKKVKLPFDIAADYIPFDKCRFEKDVIGLSVSEAPPSAAFDTIIHRCSAMKEVIKKAEHLSRFDIPVLILGESGTGKELLAKAIHNNSERKNQPFIAVNCGAIPNELVESELFGYVKGAFTGALTYKTGLIESADKGTLFLDEIGELPKPAQVKLLRVIQEGVIIPVGSTKEKAVEFRAIAATNKQILKEVEEFRFREDLFHRIAVGIIELPPIRERKGDMGLLIDHLIGNINETFGRYPGWNHKKLSAGAKNIMLRHLWPGNVRELNNALTRMALWSRVETIAKEEAEKAIFTLKTGKENIMNLPTGAGFDLRELIGIIARHYLEKALEESGGNKTKAAELLGFSNYQTLSNWCSKYGLD